MSLHSIRELVRDKDVLLVGNNLTAVEKEQGYLIDKYDIVVRFGKGNPMGRQRYLGSRTDIWVTGSFREHMRGFYPDAEVLFNTSTAGDEPKYPKYEHTPMYMPDECKHINSMFGGNNGHFKDGGTRLSAGAITAYWLYHEVETMRSMSFINFDFFTQSVAFKDKQQNFVNKSSCWHMPLSIKEYTTLNPADHSAHSLKVEKALFDSLLQNDNVYFLGLKPTEPKMIKASKNLAYDDVRERIDAEQDSS